MAYKTSLAKSKEMLDRINKRKADREAKKTNAKLEEGVTEFRLMPAFNEAGEWHSSGFFHYGFDDIILCPTTYEEDCPICEFVSALWKGSDEDKEQAKAIGRKLRYFIQVNIVALKKPDGEVVNFEPKVKILGTSETIVKCLAEHMQNEDYGDLTDPKTGRNIRIKREGKGKNTTRYGDPTPRPNASAIENFEELEKGIVDLNEYVMKSKKSYEQIKAILENTEAPAEADETGDGVEEPKTSPSVEAKAKDDWDDSKTPVKAEKTATKPVAKVEATTTVADNSADDKAKKPSIKDRLAKIRATGK